MIDANAAKEAARRLFKRVSYQDGPLGSYELSSLLTQTYQILKTPFKPSQNDIKIYEQVLDADQDGKVTLRDLEARAVEYLCSNNLISSISSSSNSQSLYKKLEVDTNPKKIPEIQIPSYSTSSYNESIQSTNNYAVYSQANYQYKVQAEPASYSYDYKSSFQTKNDVNQGSLSNFGNETLYSYQKNSNYSKSNYDQSLPNQASNKSFQYGYTSGNDYNTNFVNQSYGATNQPIYTSPQTYNPSQYTANQSYGATNEPVYTSSESYNPNQYTANQSYSSNTQNQQQAYQYQSNEQEERPYSENVKQYLAFVGQVFMAYADPSQYTVTQADVPGLLTDTYAVLGRQGYQPSKQDVQTWMKLCDVNQDGKVEFQEYEYFVVKSLERSGLNLYD